MQVMNPLNFWCSPGGATPDYVSTEDFKGFVAYGLYKCWLGSDENDPNADCNMERAVTNDDVHSLRIYFLNLVETIVAALWRGDYKPGAGSIDGDWQSLTIDVEDGNNPTMLTWYVRLDDDSMLLSLEGWGDSENIWLKYNAIEDRKAVLEALVEARKTVAGIGDSGEVYSDLKMLVV